MWENMVYLTRYKKLWSMSDKQRGCFGEINLYASPVRHRSIAVCFALWQPCQDFYNKYTEADEKEGER